MPQWYVVAKEPAEADFYVEVFGPFRSETDARAYVIDLTEDNGWQSVEALLLTATEATLMATGKVLWPYKEENGDE
jgi:hypothetical protein